MASDLFASTMKAACFFQHGGAQIDIVNSFPKPILRKGDLLIKILAASVNPVDIKLHQNNFWESVLPLPKVPGRDFCGIIEEIVEPSGRWNVGDRVMGTLPDLLQHWGSCAEYVAMNEMHVVKVPFALSDVEAASLPFVSTTVVQALAPFVQSCEGNTTDKTILIHGGAGGLGTFAIQYCTNVLNMKVTTTCSPFHDEFCRSLGAVETIDYNTQKFEDNITGCDVVLDPFSFLYKKRTLASKVLHVGSWYISIRSSPHSLNVFLRGRKVTSIQETRPMNQMKIKWEDMKSKIGLSTIHYHPVSFCEDDSTLSYVLSLVEDKSIHPCVDKVFELEEIVKAHRYVEKGHTKGKVVIRVHDQEHDRINADNQVEI